MGLFTVSGEMGQVGQTLGAGEWKTTLPPLPMSLVHVAARSTVDDAGLTFQVTDAGAAGLSSAIDISLTATNGTWISKHFGGANDPVAFAAGDVVGVTLANAAADTRVQFTLTFLY